MHSCMQFLFLFHIIIISITNFPKHTKIRNIFTETKNVFLNKEDMCRTSKKFVSDNDYIVYFRITCIE